MLAQFPDIVAKAANEYKPNYIAQYVFDVAQTFNSFYAHHQIITDNKNLTIFRVRMVMCVQQVLANAMRLLGIDTVPQM